MKTFPLLGLLIFSAVWGSAAEQTRNFHYSGGETVPQKDGYGDTIRMFVETDRAKYVLHCDTANSRYQLPACRILDEDEVNGCQFVVVGNTALFAPPTEGSPIIGTIYYVDSRGVQKEKPQPIEVSGAIA